MARMEVRPRYCEALPKSQAVRKKQQSWALKEVLELLRFEIIDR